MSKRSQIGGLQVASELQQLLEAEILPGTGVTAESFWQGLEGILTDLTPRNRELLAKRESLQQQIDNWHREQPGVDYDPDAPKNKSQA